MTTQHIAQFRCPSCFALHPLPLPANPPTLGDQERQRIQDSTIRALVERLTAGAVDPERIGRRVIAYAWRLNQEARGEKLKALATRLKVSSARASQAIDRVEQELAELTKVKPPTAT